MRLFIASSFEPGFLKVLEDIRDYARDKAGKDSVKWVEGRNLHLTYVFLGEVPDAAPVARIMESALEGCRAFRVGSGGLGAFPSSRNPRVLWISVAEGAELLRGVNGRLAEALTAGGIQFEDRFEPHITLGRVKRQLPDNFFRRAADYASAKRVSSAIASVDLMQSVSSPEGPVYRKIVSKSLL